MVGIFIIELPSNLLYNLSEMVISYYTFRMHIPSKRWTSWVLRLGEKYTADMAHVSLWVATILGT